MEKENPKTNMWAIMVKPMAIHEYGPSSVPKDFVGMGNFRVTYTPEFKKVITCSIQWIIMNETISIFC